MEENVIQINGIMQNVDVNAKNVMYVKKNYVQDPATCSCENGKYLASIMDDSAIRFDEYIELHDEHANFNDQKATCKTQNFYILLAFSLITVALLIVVSIYCHQITC